MGIEQSKLIKLYQKDLIQNSSAGAIIPEGFIITPDGLIEGIQFILDDKKLPLNIALINSPPRKVHAELISRGVAIQNKEVKELLDYIPKWLHAENQKLLNKYTKPMRNGFLEGIFAYVSGSDVYFNEGNEIRHKVLPLELPDTMKGAFEKKGCKEFYYNVILNKLASNFVVVAVLIALSGCLVEFVNIDGGGFHFFGPSGVGKTILLRIAASVIGSSASPDQGSQDSCYMMSWGSTKNGIEAKFNFFNNGLLILDELAKYTSKNFGSDVYAIAGGSYTARMNSDLESVDVKPASFIVLSSGELSMQEMVRRSRESSLGQGKSVRMPGVPIQSSDLFSPELYSDSEAAARDYEKVLNDNSGFLFEDFIQKLLNHKASYEELKSDVRTRFESTFNEMKLSLPNKGSIESRVLKRFALLAVAGQLAHEFGVLPWTNEKVMNAISSVYMRYHSYEPNRLNDAEIALRVIKRKLQSEQGNFVRVKSTTVPNKHYGYISDTHYYIYPETFKRWLSSANESEVVQLLRDENLLKSESGRNTLRTAEHLPIRANVRSGSGHNQRRETFICIDRDIVSLELD
ncbi:DUF927 domain-containing protein [Pseudoalteromonas distincta]|uniref:DUF927 domain-containing protein n=1 Tax=Pseudoalteromonas distincta TaxID=77608 RepID=UPI00186A68D7|nr:DUF927 domain-containing protein [Pseudoalteromonas distincta]MBE3672506.1 hypothetical protein [Pseudoalteromonas distincta KMM 3548]